MSRTMDVRHLALSEKGRQVADDLCIWGHHIRAEILPACEIAIVSGQKRILIHGERGTGKGQVAAFCSALGGNREMLSINLGALTPDIALSELFGHVKGAFTGAVLDRAGMLQAASKRKATLFLDEIDKLPEVAQYYLLRFLENGEIQPVGSDKAVRINNILIVAAAREIGNVTDEIRDRFWELPALAPLRDRVDFAVEGRKGEEIVTGRFDIGAIVEKAFRKAGLEYVPTFIVEAVFSGYWAGNVRELMRLCDNVDVYLQLVKNAGQRDAQKAVEGILQSQFWGRQINRNILDATGIDCTGHIAGLIPGRFAKKLRDGVRVNDTLVQYIPQALRKALNKLKAKTPAAVANVRQRWMCGRETSWRQSARLRELFGPDNDQDAFLPWDLRRLEGSRIRDACRVFQAKKDAIRALGISDATLNRKMRALEISSPWKRGL